ncbi:MAG TPA: hypothetical protein EYP08_08675 [Pyrodictiaceae archaeon]|nr:hypothetical protein [Pyrodictiaceae archaeon]
MGIHGILVLRDYGPFREAQLELSELTIIIGRNSTGKSLLAYTYTALRRALNPLNLLLHVGDEWRKGVEFAAKRFLEKVLRGFTGRSPSALVSVGESKALAMLNIGWGSITVVLGREEGVEKVKLELYDEKVKEFVNTAIQTLYEKKLGGKRAYETLVAIAAETGLLSVIGAYFDPVVLVDSRSGIVKMISKLLPYASLVALQQADLELELALYISSLASALESGEVDLDAAKPLLHELGVAEVKSVGRDIFVRLATGLLHTLANAPSGVREALPLTLALTAKALHELVIEEPEAHLHPAAVKALARVIARSINRGKWVLITTHSDLLLSAINNLIMLYAHPEKARTLGLAPQDLIAPAKVAAYVTRLKGSVVELQKLQVDEIGIPEDEFAQVVRGIADERAEALS